MQLLGEPAALQSLVMAGWLVAVMILFVMAGGDAMLVTGGTPGSVVCCHTAAAALSVGLSSHQPLPDRSSPAAVQPPTPGPGLQRWGV